MDFAETKLPQNPLIQDAFKYSQNYAMTVLLKEFTAQFMEQLEMQFEQNKVMLDMARRGEEVTKEEYQKELADMKKNYEQGKKVGPIIMKKQTEQFFRNQRVALAQELAQAGSASPDVIAAALVMDCLRSPVDAKSIGKALGDGIAGLAGEIAHIRAYPEEQNTLIGAASDDAKRLYMAVMTVEFTNLKRDAQKMKKDMPEAAMTFSEGREQDIHKHLMALAPADIALAKRVVSTFNDVARELGSRYQMEMGADNSIFLVKSDAPRINDPSRMLPPPKDKNADDKGPTPPKPNGPTNDGWGADVF
jgi:hypothetical protein